MPASWMVTFLQVPWQDSVRDIDIVSICSCNGQSGFLGSSGMPGYSSRVPYRSVYRRSLPSGILSSVQSAPARQTRRISGFRVGLIMTSQTMRKGVVPPTASTGIGFQLLSVVLRRQAMVLPVGTDCVFDGEIRIRVRGRPGRVAGP